MRFVSGHATGSIPPHSFSGMRQSFLQVHSELGNQLTEPAATHLVNLENQQPLLEERGCLVPLSYGGIEEKKGSVSPATGSTDLRGETEHGEWWTASW